MIFVYGGDSRLPSLSPQTASFPILSHFCFFGVYISCLAVPVSEVVFVWLLLFFFFAENKGIAISKKGFPGGTVGKEPAGPCGRCKRPGFDPWAGKTPWGREWQPAPVFLPGRPHGQRSLVGYSPWGHKESDTTERVCLHEHMHTHTIIYEGQRRSL